MGFEVHLYRFTEKRVNSTMRPEGEHAPGWHYQGQATPRRGVSILAPVLSIQSTEEYPLVGYNYAYIPRYKRYYWITDIKVGPANLWYVYLSCDVLATYRDDIAQATEYVARASADSDGRISDGMYLSKAGSLLSMTSKASPWLSDLYTGTFVVGCINGITGATATAVTYYAMSASEYGTLLNKLQSQTTMADMLGITVSDGIVQGLAGCLENISYDVYVAQLNPIQYIVSSVYIPVAKDSLTLGAATYVDLGRWRIPDLLCTTIGYRATIDCGSITIPKHPQASSRGAYLNMPPHSTYSMHFPGFGVIELNGARVGRRISVKAKVVFDPYNGSGYLYLNTEDGDEKEGALGILTGNIGIPVPVTQMLATDLKGNLIANVAQIASNFVSDKGGVMTQAKTNISTFAPAMFSQMAQDATGATPAENPATVAQATGANPSAILDGVQQIPTLAMSGSVGGSSGLYGDWWIKLEYFTLVDEDNETLGRPLMQIRQLGSLPGYLQVINPHILCIGSTAQEQELVNQYAANGFFME